MQKIAKYDPPFLCGNLEDDIEFNRKFIEIFLHFTDTEKSKEDQEAEGTANDSSVPQFPTADNFECGESDFELALPSVSPMVRRFTDNNSKISFMNSIGLNRVSDEEKRGWLTT